MPGVSCGYPWAEGDCCGDGRLFLDRASGEFSAHSANLFALFVESEAVNVKEHSAQDEEFVGTSRRSSSNQCWATWR